MALLLGVEATASGTAMVADMPLLVDLTTTLVMILHVYCMAQRSDPFEEGVSRFTTSALRVHFFSQPLILLVTRDSRV